MAARTFNHLALNHLPRKSPPDTQLIQTSKLSCAIIIDAASQPNPAWIHPETQKSLPRRPAQQLLLLSMLCIVPVVETSNLLRKASPQMNTKLVKSSSTCTSIRRWRNSWKPNAVPCFKVAFPGTFPTPKKEWQRRCSTSNSV